MQNINTWYDFSKNNNNREKKSIKEYLRRTDSKQNFIHHKNPLIYTHTNTQNSESPTVK